MTAAPEKAPAPVPTAFDRQRPAREGEPIRPFYDPIVIPSVQLLKDGDRALGIELHCGHAVAVLTIEESRQLRRALEEAERMLDDHEAELQHGIEVTAPAPITAKDIKAAQQGDGGATR